MIDRWEEIDRKLKGDYDVFRVYRDVRRSPRTGEDHVFHLIESVDWVNIIPMTTDGRLVMIEQYRHGTRQVTLEIPGGLIDDSDDSPRTAARREMIEETGYDSDRIEYLGVVAPNPAVQTNRCYSFLALDVEPIRAQTLDVGEDIVVRLVEPDDVPRLVAGGEVAHALVIAAFYLYAQHANGRSSAW